MAEPLLDVLLDTNIGIAHLRNTLDVFALGEPEKALYVPLTVLGELYHGTIKSVRAVRERQALDRFLARTVTLYPGDDTAEWYAKIAVRLEAKGRMIPQNDLWIAALALEYELPR